MLHKHETHLINGNGYFPPFPATLLGMDLDHEFPGTGAVDTSNFPETLAQQRHTGTHPRVLPLRIPCRTTVRKAHKAIRKSRNQSEEMTFWLKDENMPAMRNIKS
jgi:hypothetical protein